MEQVVVWVGERYQISDIREECFTTECTESTESGVRRREGITAEENRGEQR